MDTTPTIFNHPDFGNIRTAGTADQPLFCLADVCKALDLKNSRDVKSRLSEKGVAIADTLTKGGIQAMVYINEANLYKCIFQSRKADVEKFQDWVTSEVLPSIRKTGGYIAAKPEETPEEIMARALIVAQETIRRKDEAIKEQKALVNRQQRQIEEQKETLANQAPKVAYHDEVLTSQSTFTTTEIAAFYGHSAKWLNDKLHKLGLQYKLGDMWHLYEKFKSKGLARPTVFSYTGTDGTTKTREQMEWTEIGRKFIHRLLSENNVIKQGKEAINAAV